MPFDLFCALLTPILLVVGSSMVLELPLLLYRVHTGSRVRQMNIIPRRRPFCVRARINDGCYSSIVLDTSLSTTKQAAIPRLVCICHVQILQLKSGPCLPGNSPPMRAPHRRTRLRSLAVVCFKSARTSYSQLCVRCAALVMSS
ncbi:hypothetical protein PHLGIDRAFT_291579 [Phlebiopsis gigantea 11061_1 CR5-6]|uniref:Uncharacterized protein n=1 Tax=Phlebiopsis gigantea (strain 11061_1 CR5-6) TaxID=745531 RepID=A0A0C3S0K2_PHLG1|nr:hypothetical protein PHLGIDRAFT_291579 [Phlebiopsis gigantea 11061_1 CR5-6]